MNEVCIHEAGHAIAALSLNRQVKVVAYTPESETKGYATRQKCKDDSENRIIAVAGIVAVTLYNSNFQNTFDMGLIENYGGGADLEDVLFKYGIVEKDGQPRAEYEWIISVEEACEHAWKLLLQNKEVLLQFAKDLEDKGILQEQDISIFKPSVKSYQLPNLLDDAVFDEKLRSGE